MNQLALDLQPADLSYRTITLTQGQVTVVDADDYDRLMLHSWCAQWDPKAKAFKACTSIRIDGKWKYTLMARLIMDAPKGMEVDHINGDTLDNRRRSNLRLATHRQNSCNRRRNSANTSGVKGVHWNKEQRKWRARVSFNGKRKLLGDFDSLEAAALAYKTAAQEAHGEFARLG